VGGAEQVLHALDRALVAADHRSIVVAQEGSNVGGILFPVPALSASIDDIARRTLWAAHSAVIHAAIRRWRVDVIHMHGVDFARYLPPPGLPVLVTLHLPPHWYGGDLFAGRPDTWFNCVSNAQHAACPPGMRLLDPVPNGVPVDALQGRHAKRRFALTLGRICPEKGQLLAIEAAKRADVALLLAGEVFPYPEHRRYFAEEIAPRLDAKRRFLGPVGFARKRRLLTAARCVLIPSLVDETSSLVAREAAACGTPVVAFPRGALPESVEHGRTGFLVHDVAEMADAIRRAPEIDAAACRAAARERFPIGRMVAGYFEAYASLTARRPSAGVA
jgi:glycosyltransferase involved in cell wall biosynthesis